MFDMKKHSVQSHPSLLPLRMALTAAERESPSTPHRVDANERRALQLIARMQAKHKKVFPFLNAQDVPASHTHRQPFEKALRLDA